jgi:ketosteroid isomerase-like protein
MLFACQWGDSKRKQRGVMTLKLEEINAFVKGQLNVILVIDQLNALEKEGTSHQQEGRTT